MRQVIQTEVSETSLFKFLASFKVSTLSVSRTFKAITFASKRVARIFAHLSASSDSFDPSFAQRIFLIGSVFLPSAYLNED
jgi:hypothetical protein